MKANLDKAAVYLAECRTMGIEVLVPDVNRSVSDFTPVVELDADAGIEKRSILFGLSAVRNVGAGLVALLVAEREANGPFADFYDFCERVDFQVLNKKTIESLIKAGGFDSLGHPRQGLLRRVRAHHRPHRVPPPRARHGRHVALRRARGRRRRCSTSGRRSPTSSSRSGSGSASRRRCSAST